jgi:uncharacterized membrane protein YdfJ with MMPL/SSD domain
MTERLARASSRRPWLVVGLWVILILTAVVLVAMFLAFEGEAEITTETETIDAWVPLFLFAVLSAIVFGVGSTARLITGAALIIIAVFWGFAMGDTIAFQQMGFGVAVALLIDATIVRSVLVPAAMKLLGRRNWYLRSWLSWLPDVHVEGAEPPPSAAPRPMPSGS